MNNQNSVNKSILLGDWLVDMGRNQCEHKSTGEVRAIEPKVMQLLCVLVEAKGQVVSRDDLILALWPDSIVGEDTLARTVSRLRSALGDSASNSEYIQTVPKKGYALNLAPKPLDAKPWNSARVSRGQTVIASTALILLLGGFFAYSLWSDEAAKLELIERADDYYMNFTHRDNEAAIELYQRVLADQSDNAAAQAGLANAMVQRVIRWPDGTSQSRVSNPSVRQALESGQLDNAEATLVLARAQSFAERAVRLTPRNAESLKSLGFVYSAQGKLEQAVKVYQQAIDLDADGWRSMINLGEIHLIWGKPEIAIGDFQRAFMAMQRKYHDEPQNIGPWQPAVGVLVAQLHQQSGDSAAAENWYKTVIDLAPFEREATEGLVKILVDSKRFDQASSLCDHYQKKFSELKACQFN